TLPEPLALDQVWLDRSGRVKLLDRAVTPPGEAEEAAGVPLPAAERALGLLRSAAGPSSRGQVLPGHAQTFLQELGTRPAEPATLAWAVQQLRDLSRRSTELKWDERLGILGVSAGIEYMVYWLAGLLFSVAIWTLTPLPLELRPLPGLAFDVALLALLG